MKCFDGNNPAPRFAAMSGGSCFGELVLGRGLTLRQADGCAGGARAIVGIARRSRSLHPPLACPSQSGKNSQHLRGESRKIMSNDAIVGFIFGVLSSLVSGIVLFWLQGKRDIQNETLRQRCDDIRIARNWADDGKKVSLRGFDLAGANLSGKDLSGADLEDANLESAKMWATNLSGANLIRVRFHNAKLVGVKLDNTRLTWADFTGAYLQDTDFTNAKMRRATIKKLKKLENCIWNSVAIDETTKLKVLMS